jgi:hypothetical protein
MNLSHLVGFIYDIHTIIVSEVKLFPNLGHGLDLRVCLVE